MKVPFTDRRARLGAAMRVGLIALVVVGGSAMSLAITTMQERTIRSQDSALHAREIIDDLRMVDGLQWRAIAGDDLDEVSQRLATAGQGLIVEVQQWRDDIDDENFLGEVQRYVATVERLVGFLEGGDVESARDTTLALAPAFDSLIEVSEHSAGVNLAEAQRTEGTLRVLTWAVTLGLVGVLGTAMSVMSLTAYRHRERRRDEDTNLRFRSLVESSQDIITVVSGTDDVAVMSSELGVLSAFSARTPKTVAALLPPEAYEQWFDADRELRDEGAPQMVSLELTRNETTVHVEGRGTVLDAAALERVWVWRDVSESKALELKLSHRAFHDPLTGIANRDLLLDRVGHALARLDRTGGSVMLLFCDLDNFKSVNDTLGHALGDELLSIVTERIGACVRPADTFARLGGDEFAVLLEEASTEDGEAFAERLLETIGQQVELGDRVLFPSLSIGIAGSENISTTGELLRNADLAMYEAKRAGKGRAEVFRNDMHDSALEMLELQADLRAAWGTEQVAVHYQPIVRLSDGAVEGFEALARWTHPVRGEVPASTFIPAVELSGMIHELGSWVLREACLLGAQLRREGRRVTAMHVNLSPQQLRDRDIVRIVQATLAETGLDPDLLVLELTEGMLLDRATAAKRLVELHALGVRIAIDDFGTGYSSISYIQQLPIDILKLDRSFVSGGALADDERHAFLHAILGLARSLELECVAEGVESHDQLAELRRLGCEVGQGYLWSAAVGRSEVAAGYPTRLTPEDTLEQRQPSTVGRG